MILSKILCVFVALIMYNRYNRNKENLLYFPAISGEQLKYHMEVFI